MAVLALDGCHLISNTVGIINLQLKFYFGSRMKMFDVIFVFIMYMYMVFLFCLYIGSCQELAMVWFKA